VVATSDTTANALKPLQNADRVQRGSCGIGCVFQASWGYSSTCLNANCSYKIPWREGRSHHDNLHLCGYTSPYICVQHSMNLRVPPHQGSMYLRFSPHQGSMNLCFSPRQKARRTSMSGSSLPCRRPARWLRTQDRTFITRMRMHG
jgi:hypothetical protein